jgi:hypothetical protein
MTEDTFVILFRHLQPLPILCVGLGNGDSLLKPENSAEYRKSYIFVKYLSLLNIFSRLLSEYVLSDRPGKRTKISHVFAFHVQCCNICEMRNGCATGVLSGAVVRGHWLMSGLSITG